MKIKTKQRNHRAKSLSTETKLNRIQVFRLAKNYHKAQNYLMSIK